MSQPAKAQEPSMEEILASIRRIIADDDANRSQEKPSEAAMPAPAPPVVAEPPSPPPAPVPPAEDDSAMKPEDIDSVMAEAETPPDDTAPDSSADVFNLTESMATSVPEAPEAELGEIDGEPEVVPEEPPPQPRPEPDAAIVRAVEEARRQVSQSDVERALLSSQTSAAVDSAFNSLAHTVLVQNARTLEDLVREMLRPMLKTWLDDNLPGLVERLVRSEIERVSRGH